MEGEWKTSSLAVATSCAVAVVFATLWHQKIVELQRVKRTNRYAVLRSKKKSGSSVGHKWNPKVLKDDSSITEKQQQQIDNFLNQQATATRLNNADQAKMIIDASIGFGVLSTNSAKCPGYPVGSVVGYAVDDDGFPFFSFSSLSKHTCDLKLDSRATLTVQFKDFAGADDGRVSLTGKVISLKDGLSDEKRQFLNATYKARHTGASWIDFDDFQFFKFQSYEQIRLVGGFAWACYVDPKEFIRCTSDPHSSYAQHVMNHMNEEHCDSTQQIIKHICGIDIDEVRMVSLDRLGFDVQGIIQAGNGGYVKARVPFTKEVGSRKGLKEEIMAMSREAAKFVESQKYCGK